MFTTLAVRRAGLLCLAPLFAAAPSMALAAGAATADSAPLVRLQRGVAPTGGGHGTPDRVARDELSPEQREAIWRDLRNSLRTLPPRSESLSTDAAAAVVQPKLDWPLRLSAQASDPDYHGISNFVDRNPAFPNQILDYNCGARSYDTSGGYNHQGVDYFTWPFSWLKMSQKTVEIIAAAPGRIIYKADGNFDQSCGFNGNPWNAVYLEHDDGSIAWYGHMKNGSLTAKVVGDRVARGEYLGAVGSSGNSTGPHLHMELYDASGALADPYAGSCNALANAWWKSQRPYADSAINQVTTGWAAVSFGTCPAIESPNIRDSFPLGSRVFFTSFYHDQQAGQVSSHSLTRPDGSVYSSWTHTSPGTYAASWWYWYFDLPASGPAGTWKYSTTFQGKTFDRYFNFGGTTSVKVKVPNGGEVYAVGATVPVKWSSNIGGELRVELWRQGAFVSTLFNATPNDGKQNWTIPAGTAPGNYKIRVIDLADETVLDDSNRTFQIQ